MRSQISPTPLRFYTTAWRGSTGPDFICGGTGPLIPGPFQGKPACTRILPGRGVCGTAAEKDQTVRVEDVHQFPGHIACDCASNSEIVIPLHRNGELYGVLDMDSPRLGRFTKEDQRGLELFCQAMEEILERNRA